MKRLMCKRLAGVAVTALALTLAGCGGSSDTKQNDPEPTALETAQKALMDAQTTVDGLAEDATDAAQLAAYEALLEAAEDVVEELGDDARHSDVEAAEEVVEDTMAEIATIRGRIASADALETAQKALMDAQTTVDGLAEDATDAAQLAAYEALLEAAEDVVEELGDDARHSDVEAAEEVVEDTMAEIATIRGRIASADALETAQKALMDAQTTVDGLAEDATDAAQLAAYEALLEAAEDVVEELGEDAKHSDVEAAEEVVEETTAEIATIRGRIASAEGQMQAIENAKGRLTTAQNAVSDMPTAAEHQAIADAAGGVVAALRANGGSQDDIAMYTGVQSLNKAWADYLNAHDGVAALTDSSTDEATRDAHQARATAAAALIPMLTDADQIRTVASAQGTSNEEVAAASGRITAAQNKARDDQRKADNAAAMQVAMAILEHSTKMDDANTPDEFDTAGNDGSALDPGLRITRGSGNAMIKLNQNDTAAKNKKFEMGTAPGAGTGWMGQVFTYTDSDGKEPMESGTVYTNIEAAEDQKWAEFIPASNPPAGLARDDNRFANEGWVTVTSVMADHISLSIIPSALQENQQSVTGKRKIEDGKSNSGTLYGVPGTFHCATNDCFADRNSDGLVTFSGTSRGVLTFRPNIAEDGDLDDIEAKSAKPDNDYLHFGYWMKSEKQKDDTYEHEIQTFAGSSQAQITNPALGSLRGSATYSGDAAGLYVRKSGFDSAGDPANVSNGTFVADVDLTAHFGNDDGKVAAATQWSISGKVSKFMDGSRDLGWTLMLDKADLGSRDVGTGVVVGTPSRDIADETTTGSAGARQGNWSASMHGNANPGNDDGTGNGPDASNDYPSSIAGEFNGHFTNGHVAGAFGATID